MKESYISVFISDLHIAKYNAPEFYHREIEPNLEVISKMPVIDIIFIPGDFYDRSYSVGSIENKYGLITMSKIVAIASEKNAKIRILEGTKGHDNRQCESFEFIARENRVDYKYISNVQEELLFPNLKVLYVPEEYIDDKDEYYKEYFSKEDEYDMIIFHGMFDKAIPFMKACESEIHVPKAPIFKTEDIKKCCKGLCIGGHVHKHMIIDDLIYYVGSFSRASHGEEEDKGYCVVGYDTKTNKYIINFIKNEYTRVYKSIKVAKAFNKLPVEEMISHIDSIKDNMKADFLRVDIDNDSTDDKCQANMTLLREHYQNKKGISIKVNLNRKRIDEIKDEEELDNELETKYSFLFDGTPIEQQFMKYAKLVFDAELDENDIKKFTE
ncbi:MAG: hypothetical protein ACRCXT_04600 [Paraclostridium sp.]